MCLMGFSAEKLYGSVWQFIPKLNDDDHPSKWGESRGRPIHFHEPHPVKKIPFGVAKCIGRRLRRTYGWEGSMFIVKDEKVAGK
jgi:hypothetical protein